MTQNYVLAMHQKLKKMPFGEWLFSRSVARRAPYFTTIKPRILKIEENFCQVGLKKRRIVQNHIGTVHVIAICNGLEMAMGVMAEASIPKHLRWLPKGMTLDYVAKAGSDIVCEAQVNADDWQEGDLLVPVKAMDVNGVVVVSGEIKLWISKKK